jgi:hypothetical protein
MSAGIVFVSWEDSLCKLHRKIMRSSYNASGIFYPPYFFHLYMFPDLSQPIWKYYQSLEDLKADPLVSRMVFYPFVKNYNLFQIKTALNTAKESLPPLKGMKDFLYGALGPDKSSFVPLGYRLPCLVLTHFTGIPISFIEESHLLRAPIVYEFSDSPDISHQRLEEKSHRDRILKTDLKRLVSAWLYLYLSHPSFQDAFLEELDAPQDSLPSPPLSETYETTTIYDSSANDRVCLLDTSSALTNSSSLENFSSLTSSHSLTSPHFLENSYSLENSRSLANSQSLASSHSLVNSSRFEMSAVEDDDLRYLKDYVEALVLYQPQWQKRLEKINEELYKRSA